MVSFARISQKKTNNIDQVYLCSRPHWFVACVVKSCQAVLKVKHYQQRMGSGREEAAMSHQAGLYLPLTTLLKPHGHVTHVIYQPSHLSVDKSFQWMIIYTTANQVLVTREVRLRWWGTVLYKDPGPIFTRVVAEAGYDHQEAYSCRNRLVTRTSLSSHSSLSLLACETLLCID